LCLTSVKEYEKVEGNFHQPVNSSELQSTGSCLNFAGGLYLDLPSDLTARHLFVKRPRSMEARSRLPVPVVEVFPTAKLLPSTPEYRHAYLSKSTGSRDISGTQLCLQFIPKSKKGAPYQVAAISPGQSVENSPLHRLKLSLFRGKLPSPGFPLSTERADRAILSDEIFSKPAWESSWSSTQLSRP